jgi:hypothetical protein
MMTEATARDKSESEAFFNRARLFGLLVGGLCAPFIGVAGSGAAVTILNPEPGSNDASPQAFEEALWVSGTIAASMLAVWGLLAFGRSLKGLGLKGALSIGLCLAAMLLIYVLDLGDRGSDGPGVHPVLYGVLFLMWFFSVPTAFMFGSLALAVTYAFSRPSVVALVASGTAIAVVVSLALPGTPFNLGGDGVVGALGFWLPTGVFTMGCCAAASGAPWR